MRFLGSSMKPRCGGLAILLILTLSSRLAAAPQCPNNQYAVSRWLLQWEPSQACAADQKNALTN
jgi:hypothetical protein